MSHQVKPNFFIVGAPKCGTTALAAYIGAHPEIYIAPKELHFFGRDLVFRRPIQYQDSSAYYSLFENRAEKLSGDASVWYLYSQCAAAEIHEFNKHAKIIAVIRNPIEFLYSEYFQLIRNGDENILDFEAALAAEPERRNGCSLPNTVAPGPVQALFYKDTARFSEQLARYFQWFPKEQIQVVVYDDLRDRPRETYDRLLRFLDVDHELECLINFSPVNANKIVRSRGIWKMTKFGHPVMRSLWRRMLPAHARGSILRWINQLNTVERPRRPMKSATRTYLQDLFRPEVERLSALLDRDLMPWVDTADGRLPETTEERHCA